MPEHNRLRVTDHARQLICAVYEFTRTLPSDERFGLSSQLRRAAVSVGLNIVEGASRSGTKELIRFLEIARGSAKEIEFALIVTEDLRIGGAGARARAVKETLAMLRQLSSLMTSLRRRLAAGTRR
jgi:four helix bundle protein